MTIAYDSIQYFDFHEEDLEIIDMQFNAEGRSWHVFGKDPKSGYYVIDDGCAGNWHHDGLLAKIISDGYERYGINEFTIYSGDEDDWYEDMEVHKVILL